MPIVSVILPTYNRANLLKRAIRSVLDQTYQDYELIIVDDCSTDDTQKVVSEFKDNRIKYTRLSQNSGGSIKPRKVGTELSTGIYIAVLDDDDYWADKNKLQFQISWLERHPKCVMVGTDAVAVNNGLTIIAKHHYPKSFNDIKSKMLMQNCFFHSSVVYRRETLEQIGGYPIVSDGFYKNYVDEYEMWLKMGLVGELVNLPIYGIGYIYNPKPLSMKNRVEFLIKHLNNTTKYKQYYPNYLKGCIFNIIITILELPILVNLKKLVRRY
jgi:glycosyltransferase involved in cell wall biosynthesis